MRPPPSRRLNHQRTRPTMTTTTTNRGKPRARGLPLLMKELAEQSSRKRTFVIRTLYAVLLFSFTTLIFWAEVYNEITSPLEILGQGRQMLQVVLALQFAGVYLFMPAITCGVITSEKERNTIGLLLLTKLGPWTIVLEKLLGRLVPMVTFLLLSLPVMGFSYALGGITQAELFVGVLALVLTVFQVGTLAIACSAFFRTTVQAFIATYLIGAMIYFGPAFLIEMVPDGREIMRLLAECYNTLANVIFAFFLSVPAFYGLVDSTTINTQPLDFQDWDFPYLLWTPRMLLDRWNMPLWHIIPRALPTVISTLCFLIAARAFVVRRAYVQPRNLVLGLFKRLDGFFHRVNDNRVTKGIVLFDDATSLPGDHPIAWRETRKRSLGTARYLVRIFVATEIPVLIVCLFLAVYDDPGYGYWNRRHMGSQAVTALLFLLWPTTALLVCVKSATLISGERSHETLDVLLSTPIRSANVIREKFQGVRRLMFVLAVPLITIVLFQTYWRVYGLDAEQLFAVDGPVLYFLTASLTVFIYLPLVAWVSFAIGLRVRSQNRAIFAALATLVAWCALPVILTVSILEIFHLHAPNPLNYAFLLSPISVIPFAEFSDLDDINNTPWLAMVLNFLFYGVILLVIRWVSLSSAARHLGRSETLAAGDRIAAGVKPRCGLFRLPGRELAASEEPGES